MELKPTKMTGALITPTNATRLTPNASVRRPPTGWQTMPNRAAIPTNATVDLGHAN